MRRILAIVLLGILFGAGCATDPNDRCYINDLQYREARRAFERTQSLDVVRKGLADAHWPQCSVNEAIYRIDKEFGISDQMPTPSRIRSETELQAEETRDQQLRQGLGTSKVKL